MKNLIIQHQNKIYAIGDQVIVSGTNFITGIIITRSIGIENYGRFALYWMIFLFLQGLCNAFIGLPAQVISNQTENKATYLENNNKLGSLLLLCFFILLYPAFFFYNNYADASFGYGYWLFPLVIILFLKQEMNRKYFYAMQSLKRVLIIDSCTYLLQLPALLISIYFFEISLNTILLILTTFGLLGQFAFYILKPNNKLPFSFKNLPIRTNWNYGKHLISTTVLQWFSGNILLISAGSIIGIAAVGVIRVIQNIMGVLHVLFLTLENVVPVKASILLNNHSKKHMFTYFKKVSIVTGIVYGIILLALNLFGKSLLSYLYGAEYEKHEHLLNLFIWLYIFIFIGTIAQLIIKTLKLNHSIFYAYVLTVIAALIISKPLLDAYALPGVVIGFGILQLITISVYLFTLKRELS